MPNRFTRDGHVDSRERAEIDRIHRIVQEVVGMTAEAHADDHAMFKEEIVPFIRKRIKQMERRDELVQKIMGNVIAAAVLGALGWSGHTVWKAIANG